MIFVLHGQDFGSRQTTPSRTASAIEVVLVFLLVVVSFRAYRRPRQQTKSQSPPKWLDRIDRIHWLLGVAVGAFMLSFALTIAAMAECHGAVVVVGLQPGVHRPEELGRKRRRVQPHQFGDVLE